MEQQEQKCQYVFMNGSTCCKPVVLDVDLCRLHFIHSYKRRNEILQKYIKDNEIQDETLPFFIPKNIRREYSICYVNVKDITIQYLPIQIIVGFFETDKTNIQECIDFLNIIFLNENGDTVIKQKKELINFIEGVLFYYKKKLLNNIYQDIIKFIPEKEEYFKQLGIDTVKNYDLCIKDKKYQDIIPLLDKMFEENKTLQQQIDDKKELLYEFTCDICYEKRKNVIRMSCCKFQNSICHKCYQKIIGCNDDEYCCEECFYINQKCPFCREDFI